MMARRVLVAVDKFKGSLTAAQAAAAVAAGITEGAPGTEVIQLPIADGGEGTLEAALANGFARRTAIVSGPTGERLQAVFGLRGDTAVVELAVASGLAVLPEGRLAPLTASSFGTGQLILAALDAGAHTIVLAVGGSACIDGGAGMLRALGAAILDARGEPVGAGGAALADAARLEVSELDARLDGTRIVLASDVDNPLLGERGAVRVYGPQKGAGVPEQEILEPALHRWADVVRALPGAPDAAAWKGAGAAGGVGFAALSMLGAEFRYGAEVVLDLVGFAEALPGTDLVVTGEGQLDDQTRHGKAPATVAKIASAAGVPVVAICGRSTTTDREGREMGIEAIYALSDVEPDPATSIARAQSLLKVVCTRIARERLLPPTHRTEAVT